MKLIVGLGNPGRQYFETRHNVGFEVVDRLARKLGWITTDSDFDRQARSNFHGLAMNGPAAGDKAMLLKPGTFMNLSGQSVRAAMDFYQLSPADVLVVLDDIALPVGRLRLRTSGSPGGHNGLKDIERALSTNAYPRLRIGIDAPPPRMPQKDYVLGRFSDEQRTTLNPVLDRAAEAAIAWMEKGIEPAMNRFNAE
jgi:PTH1 family peptidyl-tRNA hydrolase